MYNEQPRLNGLALRVDAALRALSYCATGATVHQFNNHRAAILGLRGVFYNTKDAKTRAEIAIELKKAVRVGMDALADAVYSKTRKVNG